MSVVLMVGYGSGILQRTIGHKKAKEVWFMTTQYTAEEALAMELDQYRSFLLIE